MEVDVLQAASSKQVAHEIGSQHSSLREIVIQNSDYAITTYLFHKVKNFEPMNYSTKHSVQSVKMRLLCISDEELASISVRPTIGH